MKKIENNKQYENALKRIDELLQRVDNKTGKDNPDFIELDQLSDLIAQYEEAYFPTEKPTLIDVIKLRMFEMDLSQKGLAEILEISNSRISEYLRGKRDITLKIAKKLHQKLDIDADIILQS